MNDDTINTSRQAHEDTLMAMVSANLFPGMQTGHASDLKTIAPGTALVIQRLPRNIVECGVVAGAQVAHHLLKNIPATHHGNVILSFDGYADDSRELGVIPEVVQFCAGLLLGEQLDDTTQARRLLPVLLDEQPMIEAGATDAINAAGQLWLVSHAFASRVLVNKGTARYHELALWVREAVLLGHVPQPPAQVSQ